MAPKTPKETDPKRHDSTPAVRSAGSSRRSPLATGIHTFCPHRQPHMPRCWSIPYG